MLSIIIPTLNEEKYLPTALDSVKRQKLKDYEVIVADAGSTDQTLEIAKSYGCRIVPGGVPAQGRNNGAKAANGDLFFFLDADTKIPDGLLEKSLQEFHERHLAVASFPIYFYPNSPWYRFVMDVFYNKMIIIFEKFLPHAAVGIFIYRDLFEKVQGYDESIKLAEDHDLGRRAAQFGKFGILRSGHIYFSDRRVKTDGLLSIGIKYFFCGLHIITLGPVRTDIFRYRFNHYKENKKLKK